MEPLTAATAFATVVSLIGQFRSERGSDNAIEAQEFMSWLSENRHEEIKNLLELNTNTTVSIKALLTINQEELLARLESLDSALATFASAIPDFSSLASELRPNNILSDQAVSILKQLDESGGSKILEAHMRGYIILHILNGNGGQIAADDKRFIEDDLRTLVEYGLLRHDYNSKGDNLYLLTRAASEYVKTIK